MQKVLVTIKTMIKKVMKKEERNYFIYSNVRANIA